MAPVPDKKWLLALMSAARPHGCSYYTACCMACSASEALGVGDQRSSASAARSAVFCRRRALELAYPAPVFHLVNPPGTTGCSAKSQGWYPVFCCATASTAAPG